MFTGMLEAVMPACTTAEERLFFQQFILDRVIVARTGEGRLYSAGSPHSAGALIAECIERLAQEGNMALLGPEQLPRILQAESRLQALRAENAELRATVARLTNEPESGAFERVRRLFRPRAS